MAGNARRGPHCIGIVFLCQEWRLWGLFFAGRSFAMKLMLSPIRQNVFLVAHHSAFLELLTPQKGPIVPFSVTTPPFGRNGRFGGTRRRCACSSPAVRPPPFAVRCLVLVILFGRCRLPAAASGLSALSLVVCDPSPPLMLARFSWRSLLCARATLLAVPLRAYAIPLLPHAESPLRFLRH